MLIPLGQTASHSAWLEQEPKFSESCVLDHLDDAAVALGLAPGGGG